MAAQCSDHVPVIEHLVNTARGFIFDTGLAPACVGSALAALRILRTEPERPAQVLAAAKAIAETAGVAGADVGGGAGAAR